MPPKALTGSQASARSQAARRLGATATPQGLVCLMIAIAGSVNSRDQLEGGVGIEQVVVGKLLALKLLRRGHARPPVAGDVEGGCLMRVLAIAQPLAQPALDRQPLGEELACLAVRASAAIWAS